MYEKTFWAWFYQWNSNLHISEKAVFQSKYTSSAFVCFSLFTRKGLPCLIFLSPDIFWLHLVSWIILYPVSRSCKAFFIYMFPVEIFISQAAASLDSRMSNEPCLAIIHRWIEQYTVKRNKKKTHTAWEEIKKNQVAKKGCLWDLLGYVAYIFFTGSKIKTSKAEEIWKEASNNSAPLWDLIRMLQLWLQSLLHS